MLDPNENPSVPVRRSAREKASLTDEVAREIISAQNALRVSKTLRLRELRQEREALATPVVSGRSRKK